ncbi:MAG: hypothetical protein RRC07_00815 [Anaerolineae bacterium]|nr:hypothetical protein [Anaerolineae bacterium]
MNVKAKDEIWTEDGARLGVARRWHYRPEDQINPVERLYAAYLEVENFDLGDALYIPDVYLAGRDETTGHVLVAASLKQVMRWTWTRTPDFVAFGLGSAVPLENGSMVGAGQPARPEA